MFWTLAVPGKQLEPSVFCTLSVTPFKSNLQLEAAIYIMANRKSRRVANVNPRPKAIRRPAQPSTPIFFDFPIDELPPELVHMICIYLKPKEIANLRLVSRLAGPVGLHYMVPEVHLLLARDSFEQLKALAEHPVASKHVTSFFFEADKLGILPRSNWEQLVAGPQYVAQVREMHRRGHPCHHASERSLRTFNREVNKLSAAPRHSYTDEEMDHAFEKYSDFIHFQQDSQEAAVQEKAVAEAMKHFPLLKKITMASQIFTSRLRKTFEPAFCTYYESDNPRDSRSEPLGVQQMRSLLLGAYHAGLKIEVLRCGFVSWRILQQDAETFARMRDSVSNVKELILQFAPGRDTEPDEVWAELENAACSSYLEAGRLKDFVTAAPKLEHLQIALQFNTPIWPAYLQDTVGEHHWPALKSVTLTMLGTTEDDLVSFCSRHAGTLKYFHLGSMGMVEGDWFSAFNRMRKVLTLDTMVVSGRLEGLGEELDFELGSEDYCPELKEGIEAYFMGPCSKEELSLDDFLDFYLPNTDDSWSEWDTGDDLW